MQHLDPETAALAALGEPIVETFLVDHVAACESCQHEIDALRSTITVAKSSMGESQLLTPPPRVWQAVHAQLGLSAEVAAHPAYGQLNEAHDSGARITPVVAPAAPTTLAAPVVELDEFRARRSGVRRLVTSIVASAAAAALIAGGVLWWGASAPRDAGLVIASAQLAALPEWVGASGQATLLERPDGERIVQVTLDAVVDDNVAREVWLLTENIDGVISLGFLSGSQGQFVVPASVDLAKFSVVDISAEILDGDPAHSGDSIVRGALGA